MLPEFQNRMRILHLIIACVGTIFYLCNVFFTFYILYIIMPHCSSVSMPTIGSAGLSITSLTSAE